MKARRVVLVLVAAAAALPAHAAAQLRTQYRTSGVFETYGFDPGLAFTRVAELSIPVGVGLSFGRFADVMLSSGYVSLSLTGANSAQLANQSVSGMLDTEIRLGINLIPGKLILVTNGAIPTGVKPAGTEELSVLGAMSSDVIGFAVPSLGTGGKVGGGLVGALPLGRFALGVGATYSYPFAYQPIGGNTSRLEPGSEFRGRLGIEGPLARKTFLRAAGVVGMRSKDTFGGQIQNGVGARYIGYLSVMQGFGAMQLTVYAFDVYRGAPSIEPTAVGAAVLPKGNLLVGGLRHTVPVGRSFSFTPRVEYRLSEAAPDTASAARKAGSSFRVGLDLRKALIPGMSAVLYGSGLFGNVRQSGFDIPLSGWRAGLVVEIVR
jgi:hypothetical protein